MDFFPDYPWFIPLFTVSMAFLLSVWLLNKRHGYTGIPGPPSVPIVGSLPFLFRYRDLRQALVRMARIYGPVFQLDLGAERVIVLSSFEAIKAALVKKGTIFSARPANMPGMDFRRSQGIALNSGPKWQEERHFILKSWKTLGYGNGAMSDVITTELQHLVQELRLSAHAPLDPSQIFFKMAANVISVLIFGERQNYDSPELTTFINNLQTNNKLLKQGNIVHMFPFVKYLPGDIGGSLCFRRNQMDLAKFCRYWLAKETSAPSSKDGGTHAQNFASMYLAEVKRQKAGTGSTLTEDDMIWTLVDLYTAGTHTTGIQLAWIILYLLVYPRLQHNIRQELQSVSEPPGLEDRHRFPYTLAVIDEILRLSSLSPVGVPKATDRPTTLLGYHLPRGVSIMTSLYSVHRDPDIWPDPDQCRVERFLDDKGQYRRREELVAFSIGRRSCIGERLARAELFLAVTTLLHRFDISLPEGAPVPDTTGIMGLTSYPQYFEIVINERDST